MKRFILGVAAALLLSAGPAAADGLPSRGSIKDTGVAIGPNWNGFYLGVGVGAGAAVHDVSIIDHGYTEGSLDGLGGEGLFGTITVGYDRVIRPGWVAGLFADYDFASGIETEISGGRESFSLIDHNYSWAVGARAGFLANPSTLLYATAGYTQADFDLLESVSETFDGYFVGAGVETFLRPDWTLKLEYRFSQFDEKDFLDHCENGLGLEPSMHTARLVLSYKFGQHH